ncbi:MAG TPA: hypothetical protein VNM37_08995, partial [Candidatus Dormibacteraeota bacterium]|nr:hypothetical protein [Candidatus Dormibacteraeota bacterium]
PGLTGVIAIDAGDTHNVALKADGTVVTWGDNSSGQSVAPPGLTNVAYISAGHYHTLVLTGDGSLDAWPLTSAMPTMFSGYPAILRCAAIGFPAPSFQWQRNGIDIIGATNTFFYLEHIQPADAAAYTLSVRSGTELQVVSFPLSVVNQPPVVFPSPAAHLETNITKTARFEVGAYGSAPLLYQWFFNSNPVPGAQGPSLTLSNLSLVQAGQYSVLISNAFGVTRSAPASLSVAPIVGWGTLPFFVRCAWSPVEVPGDLLDPVQMQAGYCHGLALRRGGGFRDWGSSDYGQDNIPESIKDAAAIAESGFHSFVLKSDGTVVHWGYTNEQPPELHGIIAIAAGGHHLLALKGDGTVIGWNPDPAFHMAPGLTNVVAIAAHGYASLALRKDGTLVNWG